MRASEVQHLSIVRAQRDKGVNVLQSIRPTRKSTFSEEGSGISFSLDRTSQRNTSRAKEKKKKKRMTNGSSEIELAMVTNVEGGGGEKSTSHAICSHRIHWPLSSVGDKKRIFAPPLSSRKRAGLCSRLPLLSCCDRDIIRYQLTMLTTVLRRGEA